MVRTLPVSSLLVSISILLAGSCAGPGDETDSPAAPEAAAAIPLPAEDPEASLPAPTVGTAERPFDHACDGWAIGYRDASGRLPRMKLSGAPPAAVFECRTAPIAELAALPFAPCDGDDGSRPVHEPPLGREGTYRTEVRYRAAAELSRSAVVDYYVHHSLDGVACCPSAPSDEQWFAAAREHVEPAEPFDRQTRLLNPFIEIGGLWGERDYSLEVLSLRRTFRLNRDRTLILIRRTSISRRTRELTGREVCSGVSLELPQPSPGRALDCEPPRWSPFWAGREPASCPNVYCTLTDCEEFADGCIQVTHTFRRGLGQDPWVVAMPRKCPSPTIELRDVECDAYVLNRRGHGVCLVHRASGIQAAAVLDEAARPLGLLVLKDTPDHYVFSAKSRRQTGVARILYLPE